MREQCHRDVRDESAVRPSNTHRWITRYLSHEYRCTIEKSRELPVRCTGTIKKSVVPLSQFQCIACLLRITLRTRCIHTRERVSKKCHGMQWKSRRRGRAVNNTRFWQTSPRARFYVLFRTRVLTENLISRPLQTTRAAIYEMFARNPTGAHFVDISAAKRSDCNSAAKSSSSRQLRFLTFARLSNFSSILNSV